MTYYHGSNSLSRSLFTEADTSHHKDTSSNERNLKFAGSQAEDPNSKFVEVLRLEPKVSYSMSSRLEKLVEEERRKHSHSRGGGGGHRVSVEEERSLTAAGAAPVSFDGGNIVNLKAHLRDPVFVNKIKKVEDRRQDLYLKILKNRGLIVANEDGSETIVSYPQTPVKIPNNLKKKLSDWTEKEKFWLNITHFPWPSDPACQKYSVQFGRDLPVIGLASYPSSGNTWLR